MSFRSKMKPWLQDLIMRQMDPLRSDSIDIAEGDVLEVGFGTALNLPFYGPAVKSLVGIDPMDVSDVPSVQRRIESVAFPVERRTLRADGGLPFDQGRFDTVVTTWTLCSIPEVSRALEEMYRVLRPGGKYLFIEHGRAEKERTAVWQDLINPYWHRVCDGCNINRKIDQLVDRSGFEMTNLARFRARGPSIAAQMYRGIATRL